MSILKVYKNRINIIQVSLGMDITTDTITSQIRLEPDQGSTLLATWDVDVIDADVGDLIFTLNADDTADITALRGWMDIKRMSGGLPYPVFEDPLEVDFSGTVTV